MTRVLVTTLPKAGTHYANLLMPRLGFDRHFRRLGHLTTGVISSDPGICGQSSEALATIIGELPDNTFVLDHVPYRKRLVYELEKRDIRVVAMVRNLYDFVVSLSHHLRREPEPDTPTDISMHELQHWIATHAIADENGNTMAPMAKRYATHIGGWAMDERAFLLRFEDVIGPRGGGLFSDQLATGLRLRDFLGADRDNADVARGLITSFRPGASLFRRGQIGGWRQEMAENTAEQIRLGYARFLDLWGYTIDGDVKAHANERPGMLEEMDRAVAGLVDDNIHLRAKVQRLCAELGREDPDAVQAEDAEEIALEESDAEVSDADDAEVEEEPTPIAASGAVE